MNMHMKAMQRHTQSIIPGLNLKKLLKIHVYAKAYIDRNALGSHTFCGGRCFWFEIIYFIKLIKLMLILFLFN